MTALRSGLVGILMSLLGGVGLGLAMPRFGGWWPLALISVAPMLLAQYRLLPYRLSGLAPGFTLGAFWLLGLVQMRSVAGRETILLIGLLAGLFFGLVFGLGRRFNERTGYRYFLLDMPVLWIGIELLRGHSHYLGSSGWLAYDFALAPALIQPVSLFGTPALGLLVLSFNAALALLVIALLDRRRPPADSVAVPLPFALRAFGLMLVLVAGWTGLSLWQYRQPFSGPQVRVALVQPRDGSLDQLARMTRAAAAQHAQLVVWPEDVLDFDPTDPQRDLLPRLAHENGIYLMSGYTLDQGHHSNWAALFNPQGELVGRFHKNHPVLLMGESWDFAPHYPVWPTALGTLGPLVCFDLSFPRDAARETAAGAQMLLIPSFGPASTARDQYHIAQFRAAENQVALVKADWAWASAAIDPHGNVLAYTESLSANGEQRLLVADVPLGDGEGTVFSRYSDWLEWGFYGVVVLRVILQMVVWRRHTAPQSRQSIT
jgi:apolipoprotein N-acyltransferase